VEVLWVGNGKRFGLLSGALLREPVEEISSAVNVSHFIFVVATPGGSVESEAS